MFAYFHKHKFISGNKGQLAPLFIIIIVVLLIMALVTINISKVSSIKTDSSNAADAAALAGGSVMANLFNNTAKASSDMWANYVEFRKANDILFGIATVTLTLILLKAEAAEALGSMAIPDVGPNTCDSAPKVTAAGIWEAFISNLLEEVYTSTVMAIITNVTAYSLRAYYHYLIVREMGEKSRLSALKLSYQFAFINSGIGNKLKEGDPPEDITDEDQRRNYRNVFSEFTDQFSEEDIEPAEEYVYNWKDGQQRLHSVRVRTQIDEVKKYKLRITNLPWGVVVALIMMGTAVVVNFLYEATAAVNIAACEFYKCRKAGIPVGAICTALWIVLSAVTYALLVAGLAANAIFIAHLVVGVIPALASAWAGIQVGGTNDDDNGDMLWATICKIEDVYHNHKVKVDVWMSHEGADMGLWQTRYPQVHSYSVVDFLGEGSIGNFNYNFDPSIVATDTIGIRSLVVGN